MPLCRKWYSVAAKTVFSHQLMSVYKSGSAIRVNMPSTHIQGNRLHLSYNRYAKTISMTINYNCVNDISLEILERISGSNLVFPNVNRITIMFWDVDVSLTAEDLNKQFHFRKPVECIRQMVPSATDVKLSIFNPSLNAPQNMQALVSGLASGLSKGAKKLHIDWHGISSPASLDLHCFVGLNYMQYNSTFHHKQFAQIIRQNALTLGELIIDLGAHFDVGQLAVDNYGHHVVYLNLHRLEIHIRENPASDAHSVPIDAIPFPSLRLLKTSTETLLGSDFLFRGNSKSLEHIDIPLDKSITSTIVNSALFGNDKASRLSHLTFEASSKSIREGHPLGMALIPFIVYMAPEVRVLHLGRIICSGELITSISVASCFGSLQILKLTAVLLELCDLIKLIRLLPRLSDLTTNAPWSTAVSQYGGFTGYLDYIHLLHYPLSNNFLCWHYQDDEAQASGIEIARCAVTLAVACPNFNYADVRYGSRESYKAQLEGFLGRDEFGPYAHQIKRLLSKSCLYI
ncbi:hypothetical protein LPJ66_006837 [Kickxella alabastrina]|uniref:Uncharacterized protein n=1 Tax=Kickxella alabastrina TaxID=61397 RepID=A0ACC1IB48_9FUNG|nr:hypothetical protein LPJ66_006837 [Kickxella alabastrina]